MARFKFKLRGKVNVWDAVMGTFELGTPGGCVKILTNDTQLTENLILAMATRDHVSITIGEEEEE